MRKGFFALALAGLMVSGCAYQKQGNAQATQPQAPQAPSYAPGDEINVAPGVIPNAPILNEAQLIEVSAVGMGVAPESTISPAQALALAKRAAIVDGYRQLGEKMYGIKVNAKETVKDMIMRNSVVRTRVFAVIKNAEIIETAFKDGLCQVQMELKLDAQRWRYILTGRK
jgi:hypothetical protein